MKNGFLTAEKLGNVFGDAVLAAIKRSYCVEPSGIFFGVMAKDGKPVDRKPLTEEIVQARKRSQ